MNNKTSQFPKDWEIQEIKDSDIQIIDGDRGKNYPNKSEFSETGFCLFLNTGNIQGDKFVFSRCEFISEDKDHKLRKGKLQRSDIVLTTRGTIGNLAYYQQGISIENIRINSGMIILRCGSGIHSQFLYQLLKSPTMKEQYMLYSSGSAQPQLPIRDFNRIKLVLPPLAQQQQIAGILSAYDDLIETNNQRIATLEQLAQQIYKEWFVRMRFPGWENTAFLHGIPEGWNVKSIGELCLKITDGSHFSPAFVPDGKPMASVKDMENYGVSLQRIKTISEQDFEKLQKSDCSPKHGDILIAKDGSYLKHVFVWNSDIEIVILSSIAILRPHVNVSSYYLALTLKQDSTKSMMSCYVSGAALPRIILDDFKKMKILIPEQTLLLKFDAASQPIYEQIKGLIEQNEVLTKTRNLLLPRLISGKLGIKQAEALTH